MKLNTIYNEDCLVGMKRIPDKSIDMILCDLPYGTTANKWDEVIPFEPLWEQYERIIKDNGIIILFGDDPFTSELICSNKKIFRYKVTWDKEVCTGFLNAKKMPLKQTEDICVFYKKLPTYNPIMKDAKPENIRHNFKDCSTSSNYNLANGKHSDDYDGTKRYPTNLISFNRKSKECHPSKIIHPTQKPVELLEYLINTYSNEGEIILDNCMGVASTGIACINTGRQFIGIELDDTYFESGLNRVNVFITDNKLNDVNIIVEGDL